MLEIQLPASSEKQTIRIFDLSGKQLYQESGIKNNKSLNLSRLANGLYYIQYTEGNKVSFEKFVISK